MRSIEHAPTGNKQITRTMKDINHSVVVRHQRFGPHARVGLPADSAPWDGASRPQNSLPAAQYLSLYIFFPLFLSFFLSSSFFVLLLLSGFFVRVGWVMRSRPLRCIAPRGGGEARPRAAARHVRAPPAPHGPPPAPAARPPPAFAAGPASRTTTQSSSDSPHTRDGRSGSRPQGPCAACRGGRRAARAMADSPPRRCAAARPAPAADVTGPVPGASPLVLAEIRRTKSFRWILCKFGGIKQKEHEK